MASVGGRPAAADPHLLGVAAGGGGRVAVDVEEVEQLLHAGEQPGVAVGGQHLDEGVERGAFPPVAGFVAVGGGQRGAPQRDEERIAGVAHQRHAPGVLVDGPPHLGEVAALEQRLDAQPSAEQLQAGLATGARVPHHRGGVLEASVHRVRARVQVAARHGGVGEGERIAGRFGERGRLGHQPGALLRRRRGGDDDREPRAAAARRCRRRRPRARGAAACGTARPGRPPSRHPRCGRARPGPGPPVARRPGRRPPRTRPTRRRRGPSAASASARRNSTSTRSTACGARSRAWP